MMAWYEEFYAAVDSMDPQAVAERCTDDTRLVMSNHDPVVGKDAVVAGLSAFWSTIAGMNHDFKAVIEEGDTAALEAVVTYTREDRSTCSLPVTTWIRRDRGLIADQRIYIDMAPLHDHAAPADG
jgi:ketosteroid isomerase-like protein